MYFRSFRNPDGTYGDITGIGVATSNDGNTWSAYNGGRPVLPNLSYTNGSGTHAIQVFAPSVLVETLNSVPTLTMVFETMDTGVTGPSALPRNYVAAAQSTDGINWQLFTDGSGNLRKILVAQTSWEGIISGQHYGNVGTPSLHKYGGTYYVYYHGFSGIDGANCLKRGFASGTTITALTKYAGNPVLLPPGQWADAGPGRGDITEEDGFYYKVIEGLRYSATCGLTVTGWGLARSANLVNWQYSARNPARIDRNAPGCGEDMPAFQKIGADVYVLAVASDISEIPAVRRYKIVSTARPLTTSNIAAVAGRPAGDGYWQLAGTGEVFAFGAATHHGNVTLPAGAQAIDIAATPSGLGYWAALSNGGVRAFGNAALYGSVEGVSLAQPVRGIVPTASGNGYWLFAGDGGIFTFGDAGFYGSLGGSPPASPVVSMAARPPGNGYWLLSANGTVYPFGAAPAAGSFTSGGSPAVRLLPGTNGNGYWIVLQNGTVYTLGTGMPFFGSTGGAMPSPITGGSVCTPGGTASGYWLTAQDGGIVEYGAARYHGDPFFTTVPAAITEWSGY